MASRSPTGTALFGPALLCFSWVLMAALVQPLGDFPVNDDWAYAETVRRLVEDGAFRPSDWTATSLLTQVLWGAAFCLPFGFSFTALRLSSLSLGLVGVLATYALMREAGASRRLATLGALLLACNPIYFALSLTFMSDVPFVALATASLWCLLRGLCRDSAWTIGLGLALAVLAILTRQVGLALPVAFAAALVARGPFTPRRLLLACLPVLGGLAIQFGYQASLRYFEIMPAKFGNQIHSLLGQFRQDPAEVGRDAIRTVLAAAAYLGLFLAPILPIIAWRRLSGRAVFRAAELTATALAAVVIAVGIGRWWDGKWMPLWLNVLDPTGIGPITMPHYDWTAGRLVSLWGVPTVIAVLGGAFLAVRLAEAAWTLAARVFGRPGGRETLALNLAVVAVGFAPLPFLGFGDYGFYDRYLIVFLPPLMAVLVAALPNEGGAVQQPARWAFRSSVALLSALAVFTLAATHDYLAWNRVRWTALHDLVRSEGVPVERIFGGFEFNGWYLYERYAAAAEPDWAGSFWVDSDEYTVAFRPLPGHETLGTYPVPQWLPGPAERRLILTQHRVAEAKGAR